MKIFSSLLAIIIAAILLVSCIDSSAENNPVSANESRENGYFSLGEPTDIPEDYSGLESFDASHFGVFACESKDCYYLFVNNILTRASKSDGQLEALCGLPDCAHSDDSCGGYYYDFRGMSQSGGRLYWLSQKTVFSTNCDGSEKRVVGEIAEDGYPRNVLFCDGWLYLTFDGILVRYPLDGDFVGKDIFTTEQNISKLTACGERVYIICSGSSPKVEICAIDSISLNARLLYSGDEDISLETVGVSPQGELFFERLGVVKKLNEQSGAFEEIISKDKINETREGVPPIFADHALLDKNSIIEIEQGVKKNEIAYKVFDYGANLVGVGVYDYMSFDGVDIPDYFENVSFVLLGVGKDEILWRLDIGNNAESKINPNENYTYIIATPKFGGKPRIIYSRYTPTIDSDEGD